MKAPRLARLEGAASLLGALALLSCGGGGGELLAREAATRDALLAAGLQPVGSVQRGTLQAGQPARLRRRFERPGCYVVSALLGGGSRGISLRAVDEQGNEVAASHGGEGTSVRFCLRRPAELALVLDTLQGAGDFVLSAYATTAGPNASAAAGASGGSSCQAPVPLEPGTEVQGDTSEGRSALRGRCGPPGAPEHVYALHVEQPSLLTVTVQSQFDAVLYVQQRCGDTGSELACNDDAQQGDTSRSQVRLVVPPGDYFVVVDGYPGGDAPPAGAYTLLATVEPIPPVEEVCRRAEVLPPGQRLQGSTSQAVDRFQASCAGGAASPEHVYRLHLQQPARVRIRTQASYDVATYLRDECTQAASEVACNDDYIQPNQSVLVARLQSGDRFLFVDGYSEQGRQNAGDFTVVMEQAPYDGDGSDGADGCADAATISGDSFELDTFRARDDAKGSCGGGSAPDAVAMLEVPRRSRLRLAFDEAEFRGVVYARRQCDQEGSEVFCEAFQPPERSRGGVKKTRIEKTLEPGTYALFVDGASENGFGKVKASVSLIDLGQLARDCRRAPLLREGRWTEGDTSASTDRFHASCGERTESPDMVYRIRLRRRRQVTIRLEGGYDTVLHLRRDCTDRSTEVACNDDDQGNERASQIRTTLDRGTYYVVVDGFRDRSAGTFKIRYDTSAP